MTVDIQIVWLITTIILILILLFGLGYLASRLSSIIGEVNKFRILNDSIHLTVKERLDEVSQKVGEGLNKSDTTIKEIRERLTIIDEAQKNLAEISSQVIGLQDILSNKQSRGAFGEIQLRDVVENILPPSAYKFQYTFTTGKRVDCLIMLPNPPGSIAIDAKFPLESFRLLQKSNSDSDRQHAGRLFCRDLSKHINDIADKYIITGETAESALLFLPSEAVYAEIHSNFPEIVEESYLKRVWIVSPTTIMATLNTVRAILRDVRMREQAELIRDEIIRILDDIRRLDQRVSKLSDHFNKAESSIREIKTSTDKITGRGEKIRDVNLSSEIGKGEANSPQNVAVSSSTTET